MLPPVVSPCGIAVVGNLRQHFPRGRDGFRRAGYFRLVAEDTLLGAALMGYKERNNERHHQAPAEPFNLRRSSPALAATCSASFFVLPEPTPTHSSPIKTSTMKT